MLRSNSLHLRAVEPLDAEFMYDVENDAQSWRYSDTIAPLSKKILYDYAETYDADPFSAGQLRLIITEKGKEVPVGIVDLYDISQRHKRGWIGIYILKPYRGKGYAEEALQLVEDYAHNTLHLHQLGAKVEIGLPKSLKLFTDRGYEIKGLMNEWLSLPDGSYTDLQILTKKLGNKES